jgi:hypothetical protein
LILLVFVNPALQTVKNVQDLLQINVLLAKTLLQDRLITPVIATLATSSILTLETVNLFLTATIHACCALLATIQEPVLPARVMLFSHGFTAVFAM